ncbi:hypothetical protein [Micromonospora sp. HM5-17]|uniref:hypothetical protein n=1 Tax=Micromonospora sp. HM5-17 TaxID=2487710 RepID=UPI000F46DF5D|nr:hypothetical protein [Micromonospora sp. HM5-17]ROT32794.1 hypothetical protein EF879_06265 [Micromonospora sp. HM5-17]
MRTGAGVVTVVGASVALLVSGCGAGEPAEKPNLLLEYARAATVTNDKHPQFRTASTPEDRLANVAAHYSPEQIQYDLLAATRCDEEDGCRPPGAVHRAADDFAGPDGTLYQRSILVKREDGSLEVLDVYVARKPDDGALLIDNTGDTYEDLEDFREHNDLLGSDDWIYAPVNITSVPGDGEVVTVSGHTPFRWQPWAVGGIVLTGILAGVLVLHRRRANRSPFDADWTWPAPDHPAPDQPMPAPHRPTPAPDHPAPHQRNDQPGSGLDDRPDAAERPTAG